MTRAITIYRTTHGTFDVHEGERYTGQLSWDEMVGQIAAMTLPIERCRASGLFGMRTPDELQAQREHNRRKWVNPIDKTLGPMVIESLTIFVREHGSRNVDDSDELLPWHRQDDERVRLAMMLLDACKTPGPEVVDAEVAHA